MPEPTPQPNQNPSVSQTPPPAASDTKPPAKSEESAYAEIDRIVAETDVITRQPKTEPASKEAPASKEKEPQDESEKTEDKSQSDIIPKLGAKTEEKPVKAAELRTSYENLKKEHQTLKAEFEKIKGAKAADDPEKTQLIESLTEKDKTIQELHERLKHAAYEQSDEYKQKFEGPFITAFEAGRSRSASLLVSDADGNERQGKPEDFDAIMRISDDNNAADKAVEMFGAKAPIVLYHRERVQELNSARYKAVEEARKTAGEKSKTEQEEQLKQQAAFEKQRGQAAETFKRLNMEAAEKYPQWFKAEENDDEGNRLLEQGFKMTDLAFAGDGLPPDKMIALHSAIRNKAAGFDRLAWKLHKAASRIKELEGQLEQFKASDPGAAGGTGKTGSKGPVSVDEEIDAMAR